VCVCVCTYLDGLNPEDRFRTEVTPPAKKKVWMSMTETIVVHLFNLIKVQVSNPVRT